MIGSQRLLVCWIGNTDLQASRGERGPGPIARAVRDRGFHEVHLLSDHPSAEGDAYRTWLSTTTSAQAQLYHRKLPNPTHFGAIYEAATAVLRGLRDVHGPNFDLTFHLSSGTAAMAAVWILLAKTRHPATLIQSSEKHGVEVASVPFDISAEFIPDLLRRPDDELERLSAGLPKEAPEFDDIIHQAAAMKRVLAKARRAAPRSVPVLIEGESGTGKDLLARAIHRASPRQDQEFVAVNCGAITASLVESELFGHEKGAFTGADRKHTGLIFAAHGGTLFLDEIGELRADVQVKLLRVIQNRELLPVGATKPVPVDVRIIAATNRVLIDEVAAGRFREDLFYRLAVAMLRLPPLRDRPGDIALLVERLLDQVNQESQDEPGYIQKKISPNARNLLLGHDWPGNVRELLNSLRRAAIWSSGDTIRPEDVRDALLLRPAATEQVMHRALGDGFHLEDLLSDVARHYLERALAEAGGNKTRAAKLVGLASYQTLTNWLTRYGIKEDRLMRTRESAGPR
jgi:DNA-binding NtrC family response regulator